MKICWNQKTSGHFPIHIQPFWWFPVANSIGNQPRFDWRGPGVWIGFVMRTFMESYHHDMYSTLYPWAGLPYPHPEHPTLLTINFFCFVASSLAAWTMFWKRNIFWFRLACHNHDFNVFAKAWIGKRPYPLSNPADRPWPSPCKSQVGCEESEIQSTCCTSALMETS